MAAQTAATQWFERTLDDSAARRLYIPQAFLTADALLRIALNVGSGLVVNQKVISKIVNEHLPYMATENLMMAAVAGGADRQEVHEVVRQASHAVTAKVKDGSGTTAELIAVLQQHSSFKAVNFGEQMDPRKYVGRSPEQVEEFLASHVAQIRTRYAKVLGEKAELKV